MDKRFLKFINYILGVEGGYSNRKTDRGGETNFGITERTAREFGYKGDMKDMTREYAIGIYYQVYWLKTNIDQIKDNALAFECLDNSINMGSGKAIRILQQSFNIINFEEKYGSDLVVDGGLGFKTLSRVNSHPEPIRILKLINGFQAKHYIDLAMKDKSQRDNIYGWINKRVKI